MRFMREHLNRSLFTGVTISTAGPGQVRPTGLRLAGHELHAPTMSAALLSKKNQQGNARNQTNTAAEKELEECKPDDSQKIEEHNSENRER